MRNIKNLSRELAQKIEDLRAKMKEVAGRKGTNDAEFVALNGQMDELVNEYHRLQKIGTGVAKGSRKGGESFQELRYDHSVGKNIERLLKKKGVTQKELALHIGINEKRVQEIIAGRAKPRIAMLARIADELGVSIENLIKKNN